MPIDLLPDQEQQSQRTKPSMGHDARPIPRRRRWRWLLAAAACALLVIAARHFLLQNSTPPRAAEVRQNGAPVHVAVVETGSFPVILNGLGTVQATNTVTVRSRVDGQIEKVGFEEGQMVREGDLLVQIDPAPFQAVLNQARAKLAQDQASLTNAKQDLDRTATLSKQGNATQQLFDQRTANVASLTAQVQADQAAIDSAKVQLDYTTIRSPLTGRAGFRLVDPGNIVHANDQNGMLTITQLQPISVIFTAPEDQLPAINEELKTGPLKVSAFSSDGKRPLGEGTLKLLDNQVDPASGTIRMKASFDNHGNALWPGLSVTTRLLLKTLKDVVVVPDAAVQRGPNGLYVYVIDDQSRAVLRTVKVSRIEGGLALVDSGLAAGERIVTSGHYRVQPGGPVQVLDQPEAVPATKPLADKVD
ncbi:MAG: efflux RND transporter periplasmic adaptor subunit [Hyphomicrobiaceae bacterium]|nr:efflux RND transporter periplasmic adaptor subunit [Hyphomicrobiaceae bacterium]